jgi:hypothetical protein
LIRTGVKLGAGLTVNVAVFELVLLNAAVITAEADAVTERDVTVNVVEVAFAGTVTLAPTVAAEELLLESVTTVPPDGAYPLSVTVPVELAAPPTTVVGFNVKDAMPVAAGFTPSVAFATEPLSVAAITEVVEEVTTREVTGNVADVELAATATEVGTVAADGLLLERPTETPLEGAGPFSVTVAVEFAVPPITVAGFSDNDETATEPVVPAGGMLYESAIAPFVPPAAARDALTYSTVTPLVGLTVTRRWPELGRTLSV